MGPAEEKTERTGKDIQRQADKISNACELRETGAVGRRIGEDGTGS